MRTRGCIPVETGNDVTVQVRYRIPQELQVHFQWLKGRFESLCCAYQVLNIAGTLLKREVVQLPYMLLTDQDAIARNELIGCQPQSTHPEVGHCVAILIDRLLGCYFCT